MRITLNTHKSEFHVHEWPCSGQVALTPSFAADIKEHIYHCRWCQFLPYSYPSSVILKRQGDYEPVKPLISPICIISNAVPKVVYCQKALTPPYRCPQLRSRRLRLSLPTSPIALVELESVEDLPIHQPAARP